MKLIILIPLIACGYAAKLDRTYLPPSSAASAGGNAGSLLAPGSGSYSQSQDASNAFGSQPAGEPGFGASSYQSNPGSSPSGFTQGSSSGQNQGPYNYNQPQRAQAAAEQGAENLRYDSENDGENFSYNFETSNGIRAEGSGSATNGVRVQGAYGYTGDDGQEYSITYTADENGYEPQGQHLPTPHPIPEEILKSIEQNARAAAEGTQEGAYRPEEYENEGMSQNYNSEPAQSPSQLYGPSKFEPVSNQGARGYNQQGSQEINASEQSQNQDFGRGYQQSTSAPGNQYNQQGQFGASLYSQPASSGIRGPQNQASFAPTTEGNQGYSQTSFGQTTGFKQSQGSSYGHGSGFNQDSQATFGQGGSNEDQGLIRNAGAGQSGYEYNRPQGSGQFGSQAPGQSGSQSPVALYSLPGSRFSQGSSSPSVQSGITSYDAPSQSGQDSQYRPGQSNLGTGPSVFSPIRQASTVPQGQFGPSSGQTGFGANQGRPDDFGAPRQPPSFNAQEGYKY